MDEGLTSVNARLAPRLSRCSFPNSRFAFLVCPGDLAELDPFRLLGGECFDFVDSWFVWHVVSWAIEGLVDMEEARRTS
jgi:hypothetical protein